jgi:hypothetical protein
MHVNLWASKWEIIYIEEGQSAAWYLSIIFIMKNE